MTPFSDSLLAAGLRAAIDAVERRAAPEGQPRRGRPWIASADDGGLTPGPAAGHAEVEMADAAPARQGAPPTAPAGVPMADAGRPVSPAVEQPTLVPFYADDLAPGVAPESESAAVHRLILRPMGGRFVRAFRYRDADRRLSFVVVRTLRHIPARDGVPAHEAKVIRPMYRPPGSTDWTLARPEAPPCGLPLYRLPELLASVSENPDADAPPVLIVEGEGKAADLAKLADPYGPGGPTGVPFAVVTSAAGSKSAGKTDWRALRGRVCGIWPDNDAAGHDYAADVAERVRAAGGACVVLDVSTMGLAEKGDASDWINRQAARQLVPTAATVLALFAPDLDRLRALPLDRPMTADEYRALPRDPDATPARASALPRPSPIAPAEGWPAGVRKPNPPAEHGRPTFPPAFAPNDPRLADGGGTGGRPPVAGGPPGGGYGGRGWNPDKPEEWPEPGHIGGGLPPAPKLDAAALLPALLARFVTDEAERAQVPADFIAAALMTTLGACIGPRCVMMPKRLDDGWRVPCNLWGVMVAGPSVGKTPAWRPVMAAGLGHLEKLAREAFELAEVQHKADLGWHEVQAAKLEKAVKNAKGDEATRTAYQAFTEHAGREPTPPTSPRLVTNDITAAKMGDLMTKNPRGLLLFCDELMSVMGRWQKPDGSEERAFYLGAWNGLDPGRIDRQERGELIVKRACVSVFGGMQPGRLRGFLAEGPGADTANHDGLMPRFQMGVFPDHDARQYRHIDRLPDTAARDAVRELFVALNDAGDFASWGADPARFDPDTNPPGFRFDDGAQEEFRVWETDLRSRRVPDAEESSDSLAAHLAKFPALAPKLALILHLAEHALAGRAGTPAGPVGAANFRRAVAWCAYLEGHAARIYALSDDAVMDAARRLGTHLKAGKLGRDTHPDGFTARDVQTTVGGKGLKTAAAVRVVLGRLEAEDWLFPYAAGTTDKGGAPTIRYRLNPRLLAGSGTVGADPLAVDELPALPGSVAEREPGCDDDAGEAADAI